jgi:hypothetical protein
LEKSLKKVEVRFKKVLEVWEYAILRLPIPLGGTLYTNNHVRPSSRLSIRYRWIRGGGGRLGSALAYTPP